MTQANASIHDAACEIAGFAAAQCVCCLFDRQPLLPMAFTRAAADSVAVTILDGGTADAISARAARWLDENRRAATAVIMDAFVTIAGSRKDAIVIEARSYGPRRSPVKIAVPYRPHHHQGGFAIHRPRFIVETTAGHDLAALTEAFFRGVSAHETGGRVWSACAERSW
jgi:hypothetical protein